MKAPRLDGKGTGAMSLEFTLNSAAAANASTDCVIVGAFADGSLAPSAQLHWRIAPPLITLAFALMAVPLARSAPRQARYGRVLVAFLGYLVGMNLTVLGTQWIEDGRAPAALGLWWMLVPLLAFATWLYMRDGSMKRPRAPKAGA